MARGGIPSRVGRLVRRRSHRAQGGGCVRRGSFPPSRSRDHRVRAVGRAGARGQWWLGDQAALKRGRRGRGAWCGCGYRADRGNRGAGQEDGLRRRRGSNAGQSAFPCHCRPSSVTNFRSVNEYE